MIRLHGDCGHQIQKASDYLKLVSEAKARIDGHFIGRTVWCAKCSKRVKFTLPNGRRIG